MIVYLKVIVGTEMAVWYHAQGMTLYDGLQALYKKYGYYDAKVTSFGLAGKDGLAKMGQLMIDLRANAPKEFAGKKVLAVRDYLAGTRTDLATGDVTPAGLPKSDVLYFELENDAWVCIRPSGTEPKIKLYVNTNAADKATAEQLNADLRVASEALLK